MELAEPTLDEQIKWYAKVTSVGTCREERAILASLRSLQASMPEDPTEEMIDAVRNVLVAEREEIRKNPMHGACGCLGPIPLCACTRRRLIRDYKAMYRAHQSAHAQGEKA